MKNLSTIVKKDLKGYFDQPTGYILIVIFSAVSAYLFFFVSGFNDTSEASVRELFNITIFVCYSPKKHFPPRLENSWIAQNDHRRLTNPNLFSKKF